MATLLALPKAYAGHYDKTSQTGGKATYTPALPADMRYTPKGSAYGGGGGYGSWPGQSVSITCSGAITTVFTWVPDYDGEEPPLSVVVKEECTANYKANSYGLGSGSNPGSASDGLGGSSSPASVPIYAPNGSGQIIGMYWEGSTTTTKYYVKFGATITLTCSPSANVTQGNGSCAAGVLYEAEVAPVVADVFGTLKTDSGNSVILIGQGALGTAECGLAGLTGHQWSIPTGKPFASYSPQRASAHVVWLGASDLAVAQPHWYFSDGSAGGKACDVFVSADATAPDGTNLGRVSAKKKVLVYAPDFFYGYERGPGVDCCISLDGSGIQSGDATGNIPGMDFSSRVEVPYLFFSQGRAQQEFVQLMNDISVQVSNFPQPDSSSSTNGEYWLDNKYPYDGPYPCANSDNTSFGKASTADSPREGVNLYTVSVLISDDFKMYLLFQPVGDDVCWVPLAYQPWHFNVDTTQTFPGNWSPNPPGSTTADGTVTCFGEFPEWDHVYGNTGNRTAATFLGRKRNIVRCLVPYKQANAGKKPDVKRSNDNEVVTKTFGSGLYIGRPVVRRGFPGPYAPAYYLQSVR